MEVLYFWMWLPFVKYFWFRFWFNISDSLEPKGTSLQQAFTTLHLSFLKLCCDVNCKNHNCLGWKGLLPPCSSRVSPGLCPVEFCIYQSREITQALWASVLVFDHPHSKKHFLVFRLNVPFFNLCQMPLVVSASAKEAGFLFITSHQLFIQIDK